jgi:hypothetical protein
MVDDPSKRGILRVLEPVKLDWLFLEFVVARDGRERSFGAFAVLLCVFGPAVVLVLVESPSREFGARLLGAAGGWITSL